MTDDQRVLIITSFGEILEQKKLYALPELSLPYPKELIRQAIIEELLISNDSSVLNALEIAFCELEWFVSQEDYDLLKIHFELFNRKLVENSSLDEMNEIFLQLKDKSDIIERGSQLFNKIQQQSKERLKQLQNIRDLKAKNKS